ncbi:hypothetical protein [Paenarthrobacter nitroguajacolicus]
MKNTVIAYFGFLALSGLVALSLLGASLLQNRDPLGVPVLAIVVSGLLLTFIHEVVADRRTQAQRADAAIAPDFRTTTTTSSAEYRYSPAAVWSAIRPAESAPALDSDVAHAFTVPAIPDGPRERQCFFGWNGSISIIEVLEEVPERLAVTQPLFPRGDALEKVVYRLDPTSVGCRLTVEASVEMPDYLAPNQAAMQEYSDSFLENIEQLLQKRALEEARE